ASILHEYISTCVRMQDERDAGIKEGIEKGSYDTKIETACKMRRAKCETSFIMNMTGLSKEEIERL
ncbi:MAG: hypothetical protein ACTTKH_06190, partial [Treponema sp.]